MATDGALESVDRYFAFYSKIKVTPFKWNKKQKQLSTNPDKLAWAHLYTSWSFGWAVCIYGALRLLKEIYIRSEDFNAHQIMMYIFYNLIILISCVLNVILILQGDSFINLVNMAINYDLTCKEKYCWNEEEKKEKKTLTEKVLLHLVPGSIFRSVCGGLISFASPVDPLQRFVVDHFPEIYIEYKFYIKFVSFIGIVICGGYIWAPVILVVIFGMIYSTGMTFWLSVLNGQSTTEDGKMAERRLMKHSYKALMVYKAGQILNADVMRLLIFAGPILFGIGSFIGIICNFATVKMYHIIPMPGYLLMPLVSTLCHGLFFTFCPRVANFYVLSMDFLHDKRNVNSSHLKRVANGCRIISFDFGNFFKLHPGSTLDFNRFITDFSIDLIMSVDLSQLR